MAVTLPTLSIVIPCYNARATVVETVQSAITQQDLAVEVIVVDDGSTDGSGDVLASAGLGGMIRFVRQQNRGVSVARNHGLDLARGEYLCFLDADDLLEPRFGAKMIEILLARNCRVGYCNYRYFHDSPGRPEVHVRYPVFEGSVQAKIICENFIPAPGAVVIERAALGTMRFDPRRSGVADWALWVQLLMREPLCFHPECLIHIRVMANSLGRQKRAVIADVIGLLGETEELINSSGIDLSSEDRARFYYRFASALLEGGRTRQALGLWGRAGGLGLSARYHCLFLAKLILDCVGGRRQVEGWLWARRTRRPTP